MKSWNLLVYQHNVVTLLLRRWSYHHGHHAQHGYITMDTMHYVVTSPWTPSTMCGTITMCTITMDTTHNTDLAILSELSLHTLERGEPETGMCQPLQEGGAEPGVSKANSRHLVLSAECSPVQNFAPSHRLWGDQEVLQGTHGSGNPQSGDYTERQTSPEHPTHVLNSKQCTPRDFPFEATA